jgi:EH_Signature domain
MNFNFTTVSLPTLTTPKPLELLKSLDRDRDIPNNSRSFLLQDLPDLDFSHLRNLDEIIDVIESDRVHNIQLLEWLYCISYKNQWDALHPERSLPSSQKIWLLAKQIEPLKQILFWELALLYAGNEQRRLADSLAEGFKSFVAESIEDRKIISFIKILAGISPEIGIASTSKQYLLTPHKLFNHCKLPTHRIKSLTLAYDLIANLFIDIGKPDDKQVKWLLDCLEKMTVEQEVKAVDRLLTTIGAEIGIDRPDLVNWISTRYSLGYDNSRWYQLSKKAQEALRKWQGAVNYGDFQKLVDIILHHSHIYLEGYERRRLQNRQIFWSNYTDRFNRIRILLPQSSLSSVKDILSTKDICILEDDGNKTEVCIFDLEEWLVVEFFRGDGSETRLFRNTPDLEQMLFHSHNLSTVKIHSLGGEIHDHLQYWQHDCEKWLRKRDKGICPNDGIKFFKITPDLTLKYNPENGLPLSPDKALKREQSLIRWRKNFLI